MDQELREKKHEEMNSLVLVKEEKVKEEKVVVFAVFVKEITVGKKLKLIYERESVHRNS